MEIEKKAVFDFWDNASCGEALYLKGKTKEYYEEHTAIRYQLEPYIQSFADFKQYHDKDVLEIGVGLGADHQKFLEAGAKLIGIDLTNRAIDNTKERLNAFGLNSDLQVADAENLPFENERFDLVYSWGVLHHSPNTQKAVDEVYRVLKIGGEAKIMIYHKRSFVGYMLWLRYALLKSKPFQSLSDIYSKYLESPGTKAYTIDEAHEMFKAFKNVDIETILTHGDLLTSSAGQRHEGMLLNIARVIWPRQLIKALFPSHGLFMLIKAKK